MPNEDPLSVIPSPPSHPSSRILPSLQGTAADFAEWIRQGGAVSKRTIPPRDLPGSSAPPPQLLHDMLQVHEGMRQLATQFQQSKAVQSMQLRIILQKLIARGLLAPESANYISSMPPQTPISDRLHAGGGGDLLGGNHPGGIAPFHRGWCGSQAWGLIFVR